MEKLESVYVYAEYNDMSVGDIMIKVSTNLDTLKAYLKSRVVHFFDDCPWDEIEEKKLTSDDELSDMYVHYDDTMAYYTWEITKEPLM